MSGANRGGALQEVYVQTTESNEKYTKIAEQYMAIMPYNAAVSLSSRTFSWSANDVVRTPHGCVTLHNTDVLSVTTRIAVMIMNSLAQSNMKKHGYILTILEQAATQHACEPRPDVLHNPTKRTRQAGCMKGTRPPPFEQVGGGCTFLGMMPH